MTFRTAEYSRRLDGTVRCRMLLKGRAGHRPLLFAYKGRQKRPLLEVDPATSVDAKFRRAAGIE